VSTYRESRETNSASHKDSKGSMGFPSSRCEVQSRGYGRNRSWLMDSQEEGGVRGRGDGSMKGKVVIIDMVNQVDPITKLG